MPHSSLMPSQLTFFIISSGILTTYTQRIVHSTYKFANTPKKIWIATKTGTTKSKLDARLGEPTNTLKRSAY